MSYLFLGKQPHALTFDGQKEISSSRSFFRAQDGKLNKRLTVQWYSWQSFHSVASDFGLECSEIVSPVMSMEQKYSSFQGNYRFR